MILTLQIWLFMIGTLGICGMTFLFPAIALPFALFQKHSRTDGGQRAKHIDILIPAHNEEASIASTIASLQTAVHTAGIQAQIVVGADACSDNTAQKAVAAGALVFELNNRSKFSTLGNLLKRASADWVAFVDCGAAWQETTLIPFVALSNKPQFMIIAPAYRAPSGGFLQQIYWTLERVLKQFENLSGGPVSVHGATVFLRRKEALEAFSFLEGENWLNDDVVIPLAMRTIFPTKRVKYGHGLVEYFTSTDTSLRPSSAEKNARERMMIGNLQWIHHIFPRCVRKNPLVALLALRRIARVYWAYWFLVFAESSLALSLGFVFQSEFVPTTLSAAAILGILFIISKRAPSLFHSIRASLLSPWMSPHAERIRWR